MDETELSFIRCPNCRSLVPAVASRCRMCGFILNEVSSKQTPSDSDTSKSPSIDKASSRVQNNSEEDRPSRVRQRTISVALVSNPDSMSITSPESVRHAEPVVSRQIEAEAEDVFDDANDDEGEEDDDFFDSPTNQSSSEITSFSESDLIKKKRKRRRRRKKPDVLGSENVQTAAVSQGSTALPNPISANSGEVKPEPAIVPIPPVAVRRPAAEEGIAPWRTPPATESRPGFRIEPKTEPEFLGVQEPIASLSAKTRGKVENQRVQEPKQTPVAGSLVGWLVSFAEDRKGVSHELRDGRFFVGREQLRASDFVIDHSTVSTPQCLVVCDPVDGVTIQDLMSERGTTLIRGSAALEKSSEQVRLENGDRIRFGEYEMLFVKLPQVR